MGRLIDDLRGFARELDKRIAASARRQGTSALRPTLVAEAGRLDIEQVRKLQAQDRGEPGRT